MTEHWFDTLYTRVHHGMPRRALIGVVVGVLSRCARGEIPSTVAAKARTKRKRRRHRSPTGNAATTPQRGTCSQGACKAAWPSPSQHDIDNRTYCEFICEQCDGNDPREFCLVKDSARDDLVATCCPQKSVCCGGLCCGPDPLQPGRRCCDERCVNTDTDERHCGQCGHRCPAGWVCVNGRCVEECAGNPGVCCGIPCGDERTCCPDASNTVGGFKCAHLISDRDHCGSCGTACGTYPQACCSGTCVDTSHNNNHCGTCFFACPSNKVCRPDAIGRGECQNP